MSWLTKAILILLIVWLIFGLRWSARSKRTDIALSKMAIVGIVWAIGFILALLLTEDLTFYGIAERDPQALLLMIINFIIFIPCAAADVVVFFEEKHRH